MKIARIVVLDESGRDVWYGSLLQFLHDNTYQNDPEFWRGIIKQLRLSEGVRPEVATIGGGAAPVFYLSRVA